MKLMLLLLYIYDDEDDGVEEIEIKKKDEEEKKLLQNVCQGFYIHYVCYLYSVCLFICHRFIAKLIKFDFD